MTLAPPSYLFLHPRPSLFPQKNAVACHPSLPILTWFLLNTEQAYGNSRCDCCPVLALMSVYITGQAPPSVSAYLALSAALPALHSCALQLVQTLLWTGQSSLLLHYAPMARMMSGLLRKLADASHVDPAPAAALLRQQVGAHSSAPAVPILPLPAATVCSVQQSIHLHPPLPCCQLLLCRFVSA